MSNLSEEVEVVISLPEEVVPAEVIPAEVPETQYIAEAVVEAEDEKPEIHIYLQSAGPIISGAEEVSSSEDEELSGYTTPPPDYGQRSTDAIRTPRKRRDAFNSTSIDDSQTHSEDAPRREETPTTETGEEVNSKYEHVITNQRELNGPEHVYLFNANCLSQWYDCYFDINGKTFISTEQYMMYRKAMLFEDQEAADSIMKLKDQFQIKLIGRRVKNFDEKIWKENCKRIVYEGNYAKFSQNRMLKKVLLNTYPKLIGESRKNDSIWGTGMSIMHPAAYMPRTWTGTNWLGKILMKVREDLRQEDKAAKDAEDAKLKAYKLEAYKIEADNTELEADKIESDNTELEADKIEADKTEDTTELEADKIEADKTEDTTELEAENDMDVGTTQEFMDDENDAEQPRKVIIRETKDRPIATPVRDPGPVRRKSARRQLDLNLKFK
ncbi:Hypothetical predicted protein [Mytilus galloprovincialis]|uniref:NADAR domain-containing protein n=1 Tax=Mytilus galloprovincialis TaxID=29158 RepID=A0A8B6BIN8_MYTGA|nr:Hypothetical predicted protein [Mytilus galloprovincialis]